MAVTYTDQVGLIQDDFDRTETGGTVTGWTLAFFGATSRIFSLPGNGLAVCDTQVPVGSIEGGKFTKASLSTAFDVAGVVAGAGANRWLGFLNAADRGYMVKVLGDGGSAELRRYDGSAAGVLLATYIGTVAVGHELRLKYRGGRITVLYDGAELGSVTDTTYAGPFSPAMMMARTVSAQGAWDAISGAQGFTVNGTAAETPRAARVYQALLTLPMEGARARVYQAVGLIGADAAVIERFDTCSGGPVVGGSVIEGNDVGLVGTPGPAGFEFCSLAPHGTYSAFPLMDEAAGGPLIIGTVKEGWRGYVPPVSVGHLPLPVPKVEIAWDVKPGEYALAFEPRMKALVPSVYARCQEASGALACWSRYGTRFGSVSGTPLYQQASPISDPAAYALDLQASGYITFSGLDECAMNAATYVSFVGWVYFPASAPAGGAVLASFGTYSLIDNGTYLGFTTHQNPLDIFACARPATGWHHIVAVFVPGNSESTDALICIDGAWGGLLVKRGGNSVAASANLSASPSVGARPDGTLQAVNYRVAEIAFVPYQLSIDQAKRLYAARTRGAVPDMNPDNWTWTDVTPDLLGWHTEKGRQDELQPVDPLEVDLVLKNYDRRYEPEYEDSPYFPNVIPMRPVRASATWQGVSYPRFMATIVDFPITWEFSRHGHVNLEVVDALALISKKPPLYLRMPSGMKSGVRVRMILDALCFPDDRRVIATGQATLGVIDTTDSGVDGLELLGKVCESERGAIFVDNEGQIVFHDRITRASAPYTVAQGTWGDGGWESSGELPMVSLTPSYSAAKVKTMVVLKTLYPDIEVTVGDTAAIENTEELTFELDDLQNASLLDLTDIATAILDAYKEPHIRFETIGVRGRRVPDPGWQKILARDFGDRIAVIRRPTNSLESPIVKETFIERVTEEVDYSQNVPQWDNDFALSPAGEGLTPPPPPDQQGYWMLGDVDSQLGYNTRLAP